MKTFSKNRAPSIKGAKQFAQEAASEQGRQ